MGYYVPSGVLCVIGDFRECVIGRHGASGNMIFACSRSGRGGGLGLMFGGGVCTNTTMGLSSVTVSSNMAVGARMCFQVVPGV